MKCHKYILIIVALLTVSAAFSQQPSLSQKQLTRSSFFYDQKEKIFITENGFEYYVSWSKLGYYIEKFDEKLNLKKSVFHKFEDDGIDNNYTQPFLINDDLYFISSTYLKKEKQSEFQLLKLNPVSLETEHLKSLIQVPGKIGEHTAETQTRAVFSQSESKQMWSLSIFVGKDFVEKAEFIVLGFDSGCNEIFNKKFSVDYENYAFKNPVSKTDEKGNVYIESRMVFKHVQSTGEEYHHIFCVMDKGTQLHIINFSQYDNLYQFAAAIDPLPDGNLFAYMITNKGMMTYLINPSSGKIIKNQPVEIDLDVWKSSAWYSDSKLTPVGMFFLPKLVKHDSNGNIYIVGEQGVSDVVQDIAYTDNYSVLIVKYNSEMEQQWYKIIPKLQSGHPPFTDIQSIQAMLEKDTLDIFMNYSLYALQLNIYEDGKISRKDLIAQTPDIKTVIKSDTMRTTDMLQLRVLTDGQIQSFKIVDNTERPSSSYYIGSVEGESSNYYFIFGGSCDSGFTDYLTCKKQIYRVAW